MCDVKCKTCGQDIPSGVWVMVIVGGPQDDYVVRYGTKKQIDNPMSQQIGATLYVAGDVRIDPKTIRAATIKYRDAAGFMAYMSRRGITMEQTQ